MIKIIKIIILMAISVIPVMAIAKEEMKIAKDIKVVSREKIRLDLGREKLGEEILNFKTKKQEKIEKLNEKRLNIYKNKLEKAQFAQGQQKILITGYSSTPDQCSGNPFITASGTHVHEGTMACPPQYPFGTKIKIKDLGTFTCEDRGGAIKGNHFDMWFTSRDKALAWGKRVMEAEISKF